MGNSRNYFDVKRPEKSTEFFRHSGRAAQTIVLCLARLRTRGIIEGMEITWLGHGTFRFRLPSGQVIVMDPWTEGNPAYPNGFEIPRIDTLCITHGHFDHIHDAVP